ncbi:hypothetical protein BMS3Bbin06_00401 [bacterium BMS3Bbin06]|nr:hypothetical protein BMS3Bbin06_00401 [bacterium BMS3Bbin06]
MKNAVLGFLKELLDLAKCQREALRNERVEDALDLQEKRRAVADRIQKVDISSLKGGLFDNSGEKISDTAENISCNIRDLLTEILSVDREITAAIRGEMDSTLGKLSAVNKLKKGFCQGSACRQSGRKLTVSA